MNRTPRDEELQNGIVGYGITNILSALFGCPAHGYIQSERGYRHYHEGDQPLRSGTGGSDPGSGRYCAEVFALLTTIPQCVLGGGHCFCVCIHRHDRYEAGGVREMDYRNSSIVGLAAALGMGVSRRRRRFLPSPTG